MKIALLTGGSNAERFVALGGATEVMESLRKQGHLVTMIDSVQGELEQGSEHAFLAANTYNRPPSQEEISDFEKKENWTKALTSKALIGADMAFLVLHGAPGESGHIQAWLELMKKPFSGSSSLSSGVAMDKDLTKRLLRQRDIPTADWWVETSATKYTMPKRYPVIVKPARVGSSAGLSLVEQSGDFEKALKTALEWDSTVLVEEFVQGREFTVGILDGKALAVGEIIPKAKVFDYQSKYNTEDAEEIFPASLSKPIQEKIQNLALRAHDCLGLGDYSRIDFLMDSEDRLFCLEANSLPGMTRNSLMPQSAAAAGISFDQLCEKICTLAVKQRI